MKYPINNGEIIYKFGRESEIISIEIGNNIPLNTLDYFLDKLLSSFRIPKDYFGTSVNLSYNNFRPDSPTNKKTPIIIDF
jgi:hypothetical protein